MFIFYFCIICAVKCSLLNNNKTFNLRYLSCCCCRLFVFFFFGSLTAVEDAYDATTLELRLCLTSCELLIKVLIVVMPQRGVHCHAPNCSICQATWPSIDATSISLCHGIILKNQKQKKWLTTQVQVSGIEWVSECCKAVGGRGSELSFLLVPWMSRIGVALNCIAYGNRIK